MFRLLGPHVNHTHGGLPEFVAAWQPPVTVVLDPTDAWSWVPAAAPSTHFVWRWWLGGHSIDFNQPIDPAQAARDHLAQIWPHLRPWMTGYVQGINEPVIGSPEAMSRYAVFEAERTRRLANRGYKAALGSFAVGNPTNLSWWQQFTPALEAGRQYGACLALHQYDWPVFLAPDADWYTLRHRKVYTGEPSHNWPGLPSHLRLPLIITETGLDVGARRPGNIQGWRDALDPDQYLGELAAYSQKLEADRYLLGAAIFCCGNLSGKWIGFDIWPRPADRLAQAANPLYRRYSIPEPPTPVAWGPDVSWWQGPRVIWRKVEQSGASFTIARVSVGLAADSTFPRNHDRSGYHGLQRGAYHYFTPDDDVEGQVDSLHLATQDRDLELGVWLDVEEDALSDDRVRQFVSAFQAVSRHSLGIYTSWWKARSIGLGPWCGELPLWVAHWTDGKPRIPGPWRGQTPAYAIHQYTNRGRVDGISGRVDLNRKHP